MLRFAAAGLMLRWGPQPTGLDVRKPAAARISAWSLAADGGGPLPSAPCRGRRRAIKPRALSAVVTEVPSRGSSELAYEMSQNVMTACLEQIFNMTVLLPQAWNHLPQQTTPFPASLDGPQPPTPPFTIRIKTHGTLTTREK
ncbi:unnamed protein product [Rangifer tarandus platyrhynchus]|uniref:Uncharacterized protein n=2 Tax=Rangifer tarandus platyrhynchus TaxID=3082113 RepID=A0ABN9A1Q0_RANTA|nr:unnamed protein product [Rangifer tarandus platyrhynchus]CAI9714324.1 unnamed protein product [Rangifer tarandus platyrhynchus]